MYNLAAHTSFSLPTWQSSRYSSEIDFIWSYYTILTYLTSFETDDTNTNSLSDHKILISCWSFPYAIQANVDIKPVLAVESSTIKLWTLQNGKNSPTKFITIFCLTLPLFLYILTNLSKLPGTKYKPVLFLQL